MNLFTVLLLLLFGWNEEMRVCGQPSRISWSSASFPQLNLMGVTVMAWKLHAGNDFRCAAPFPRHVKSINYFSWVPWWRLPPRRSSGPWWDTSRPSSQAATSWDVRWQRCHHCRGRTITWVWVWWSAHMACPTSCRFSNNPLNFGRGKLQTRVASDSHRHNRFTNNRRKLFELVPDTGASPRVRTTEENANRPQLSRSAPAPWYVPAAVVAEVAVLDISDSHRSLLACQQCPSLFWTRLPSILLDVFFSLLLFLSPFPRVPCGASLTAPPRLSTGSVGCDSDTLLHVLTLLHATPPLILLHNPQLEF